MELLNHEVYSQVIEHTYIIKHHFEGRLVYKEWVDSGNGQCLDFVLESINGSKINNNELMQEVQDFIATLN
jgi:hypothetical protein